MTLDADAQAIADMTAGSPRLHEQDLEACRTMAAMNIASRKAEMHEVYERRVPGPHGDVPVRVYRPVTKDGLPVLVYMHGGGWSIGGLDTVDGVCRELASRAECVVVSVDYRLAPEHKFPIGFEDSYAVVEWVADHAGELGADGGRLAVAGDSAGANFSAAICLRARDENGPHITFQLLAYPATEYGVERPSCVEQAEAPMLSRQDVEWFWGHYLRDATDSKDPRATPSSAASHEGLPPALVVTAEHDPLRDDGEAYGELLRAGGVEVTVKRYPGVFHGFFIMVGLLRRNDEAMSDAADALKKAFGTS
ncbi:alpha/beta hydrolase [Streptomyces geranii]|uniref:alpha/beta hydrolase n=1 Tax=Streptomyces geranii TaxID=2058923 RepID=UPI000D02F195|nr:alpha/beta hydrolase [Streptomyces geranii]